MTSENVSGTILPLTNLPGHTEIPAGFWIKITLEHTVYKEIFLFKNSNAK